MWTHVKQPYWLFANQLFPFWMFSFFPPHWSLLLMLPLIFSYCDYDHIVNAVSVELGQDGFMFVFREDKTGFIQRGVLPATCNKKSTLWKQASWLANSHDICLFICFYGTAVTLWNHTAQITCSFLVKHLKILDAWHVETVYMTAASHNLM